MVALYSPLVFSTPLSLGLLPPTPPPGENSDDHALRCVFFLSFLPLFLPLSCCPSSLSFFFFLSLPLRISPVSLYIYIYIRLQTKFYVYFIRTYTRSTPFVYTCTFVRPDVRIVINTTLASPYNARRFCVPALSSRTRILLVRLCSAGAIDQVCLAECTRSYCFHSLSSFFFPPSSVPSTLRIRLWYPHPRVFPSFFSRDTCSSPIGSVVRLAASGDPFRFAMISRGFHGFSHAPRFLSPSFFFFISVFRHVAPYNRSYECYFQLRQMILFNLINVQQSSNWKRKNDAMLSFANGSR